MKTGAREDLRLSLILLLLSDDEELANFVLATVKHPWNVVRHSARRYVSEKIFAPPNVRLAILDDQAVEEDHRSWLLAKIRRHFTGTSLIYVAGSHSHRNEMRARTNGAHYYVSKPLDHERFLHVLQSFLHIQQAKG